MERVIPPEGLPNPIGFWNIAPGHARFGVQFSDDRMLGWQLPDSPRFWSASVVWSRCAVMYTTGIDPGSMCFPEVAAMKRLIFLSAAGVVVLAEILILIFPSLVPDLVSLMPASLPTPPKGFDSRREGVERGKLETVEYDSKAAGCTRKCAFTPHRAFKGADVSSALSPTRQPWR